MFEKLSSVCFIIKEKCKVVVIIRDVKFFTALVDINVLWEYRMTVTTYNTMNGFVTYIALSLYLSALD